MPNELVTLDGHNLDNLSIHLHKGQQKAFDSERRFVFIIAGTQSGKTSFGPFWLHREIERCGEGDYLAVTATYDLFKLKMLPEMLRWFVGWMHGWEYRAGDRVIKSLTDDTRIILRSANVPEGLESATAKAAWLDECGQDTFRLGSWEAVLRRLSLHRGRILGSTTVYNLGWLKSEVYDRWRAKDKDFDVINFSSIMNPAFPVEEYERAKATLPKWKFEMFYNGNFSRPAGMIYEDIEDYHYIDPIALPPEWPRYVGIDFGAVNTSLVWLVENPDKQIYYAYRESLEGGKTTVEHAAEALELAENENIVIWAGGSKSEDQYRMDWGAAGIPVIEPTISDVEGGIDRVTELIKTKRLYIFNHCKGLRDELGRYSRVLDDQGQPTDKIADKETFHRLDGLRYIVQHLEGGSWYIS